MLELLDSFFIRAVLGGLGVALVAAPLGCFVVWRRMAYFGDAMAHSALLGVALGILLGVELRIGIAGVLLAAAFLLSLLQRQKTLAGDTLLGILAHASLALGLVTVAFLSSVRVDLYAFLFGDILAVSRADLLWIYATGLGVMVLLWFFWRDLLTATLDADLARAEGIKVERVQLLFMLAIAVTIAMAMKVVGILLVTSLLILPAAAARMLSRTPEQMAIISAGAGALAVILGLNASLYSDSPGGPSIVVAAACLLVLAALARQIIRR